MSLFFLKTDVHAQTDRHGDDMTITSTLPFGGDGCEMDLLCSEMLQVNMCHIMYDLPMFKQWSNCEKMLRKSTTKLFLTFRAEGLDARQIFTMYTYIT